MIDTTAIIRTILSILLGGLFASLLLSERKTESKRKLQIAGFSTSCVVLLTCMVELIVPATWQLFNAALALEKIVMLSALASTVQALQLTTKRLIYELSKKAGSSPPRARVSRRRGQRSTVLPILVGLHAMGTITLVIVLAIVDQVVLYAMQGFLFAFGVVIMASLSFKSTWGLRKAVVQALRRYRLVSGGSIHSVSSKNTSVIRQRSSKNEGSLLAEERYQRIVYHTTKDVIIIGFVGFLAIIMLLAFGWWMLASRGASSSYSHFHESEYEELNPFVEIDLFLPIVLSLILVNMSWVPLKPSYGINKTIEGFRGLWGACRSQDDLEFEGQMVSRMGEGSPPKPSSPAMDFEIKRGPAQPEGEGTQRGCEEKNQTDDRFIIAEVGDFSSDDSRGKIAMDAADFAGIMHPGRLESQGHTRNPSKASASKASYV